MSRCWWWCAFYICEYVCVCVCLCSPLGIPVTGLRDTGWSDSWDACDVLLLLCCPYVRDLRNCCYFFRWNLSMILNVLLQTKEKVPWHARKGENNPKWDKNQNQICPKKKRKSQKKEKRTPTNKVKADNMRLRVHYCKINSMSMNNN